MDVNEKLQHLNSEELSDLIERYYNNEKVCDLIKEFNINCTSSELYSLFPPEQFDNNLCMYCNRPMIRNRTSRGSYKGPIYCPSCLHKFDDIDCNCDGCNNKKRNIILKNYKYSGNIDISEISLKDRIYIATLLRGLEWVECNDKIVIYPLETTYKKLAPIFKREIEMLRELSSKGIISVECNSNLDAFTGNLLEGTYGDKYYINKVRYSVNIEYSNELSNPNIDLSDENIDEIYYLVREIIMDECYDYLENQMNKVRFAFNPGKITEEVFNDLLDKFSVGQVYSIIYNSITNATRYYQEGNVYKNQAANSVITRCRAYGERIIANNWELKPFSRPRDCEQSIMSSLFFNRILSVGDNYFATVYSNNSFKNLIKKMTTNLI